MDMKIAVNRTITLSFGIWSAFLYSEKLKQNIFSEFQGFFIQNVFGYLLPDFTL